MTASNDHHTDAQRTTGTAGTVGTVIDLTRSTPEGPRTRVRVEPGRTPLEMMSHQERMRLFIRVLCELVAYGELEGEPAASAPD